MMQLIFSKRFRRICNKRDRFICLRMAHGAGAGGAGDFRTLKMIDKLTAQYDIVACPDDTADFMERSHRNDILEEKVRD